MRNELSCFTKSEVNLKQLNERQLCSTNFHCSIKISYAVEPRSVFLNFDRYFFES